MEPAEILRVAAASYWVPPNSEKVTGDGFVMVRYDNGFVYDTGVYEIDSERPAAQLYDDVVAIARHWGRPATYWNDLSEHTRPAELVDHLRTRGAVEQERLSILVADLTAPRPDLDVPEGIHVEVPLDRPSCEASAVVAAEAFGDPLRPVTDDDVTGQRATVESGAGTSYLAYVDGRPAATGGLTYVADGRVAKLWGGATVPWARRRGAYRAVLAARLRAAVDHGCEAAVVGGRVSTSAPILRRAGFRSYGEEVMLRVPVDPAYPGAEPS